ncbi:exodeoxyribonuclease I [Gammaproteobacteria bacterium]|nr:exodeoxyribonuclease I [Gammaproteobacteria bacterium]
MANTIFWYDFETFSADPRIGRAAQFAGLRTDENLNVVGDPLVIYCKPSNDFLPDPFACHITGITPQEAQSKGMVEARFIKTILSEFTVPNTCISGYNNIRFDDELTRQLLYRNFFDPYEHEYKNGNSRWDIIDMVRLCAATRPEGIEWPKKSNGFVSFRLDELTVKNGIEHGSAHDALSDVRATIQLAKLIKISQPKLYDYCYSMRSKNVVKRIVNFETRRPFLLVSPLVSARHGCLSLMMPLCMHPRLPNTLLAADLRQDPKLWMDLGPEELAKRLFLTKSEVVAGKDRVLIRGIALNKCPIIVNLDVLDDIRARSLDIDKEGSRKHWGILTKDSKKLQHILHVISEVFAQEPARETDPDLMIYDGFFTRSDKQLMATIREAIPEDLNRFDFPFKDRRLKEMFFRYRARNYLETLNSEELALWEDFRMKRINSQKSRDQYNKSLVEAMNAGIRNDMLEKLEKYVFGLGI